MLSCWRALKPKDQADARWPLKKCFMVSLQNIGLPAAMMMRFALHKRYQ
jgi:hypothetical protein